MKFVISSSLLSSHLMTLGRVIVSKNNLPILDCFRFEIKGMTMTITASDNDTTIVTDIPLVEADAEVTFAVNAKTLQDAIKEIPEQPLDFYLNTESLDLTIEYQNGQYKLMAQSAEDFPMPVMTGMDGVQLTMNAGKMMSGLTRAAVAVANDVLRPQLNCACFDVREGTLSLVASNGNHLALTRYQIPGNDAEGIFLLSTRPSALLRGVLAKEQGDVVMSFGNRGAIFRVGDYQLSCRLVEGRYPNYRSVIPQNNPNIVTLNRQALVSALRRVMVFANPAAVLVKFRLEADTMIVSSQDNDFGKSAEENMLCDYHGNPMRIAFKGTTLLELIQNIDSDEIHIQLSDPSRAGVVVPTEQKEDEHVLMLMMPSVFND